MIIAAIEPGRLIVAAPRPSVSGRDRTGGGWDYVGTNEFCN